MYSESGLSKNDYNKLLFINRELQKIVTHVGLLQNGHLIKECEIEKISDTSLENYYFNEFEGENK